MRGWRQERRYFFTFESSILQDMLLALVQFICQFSLSVRLLEYFTGGRYNEDNNKLMIKQ